MVFHASGSAHERVLSHFKAGYDTHCCTYQLSSKWTVLQRQIWNLKRHNPLVSPCLKFQALFNCSNKFSSTRVRFVCAPDMLNAVNNRYSGIPFWKPSKMNVHLVVFANKAVAWLWYGTNLNLILLLIRATQRISNEDIMLLLHIFFCIVCINLIDAP